jgi:hypothetical protein
MKHNFVNSGTFDFRFAWFGGRAYHRTGKKPWQQIMKSISKGAPNN